MWCVTTTISWGKPRPNARLHSLRPVFRFALTRPTRQRKPLLGGLKSQSTISFGGWRETAQTRLLENRNNNSVRRRLYLEANEEQCVQRSRRSDFGRIKACCKINNLSTRIEVCPLVRRAQRKTINKAPPETIYVAKHSVLDWNFWSLTSPRCQSNSLTLCSCDASLSRTSLLRFS